MRRGGQPTKRCLPKTSPGSRSTGIVPSSSTNIGCGDRHPLRRQVLHPPQPLAQAGQPGARGAVSVAVARVRNSGSPALPVIRIRTAPRSVTQTRSPCTPG